MNDYESGGGQAYRLQAPYSPGIFFTLAPATPFGLKGPFVLLSLLGLMGLFFFYLTVRKLYGVETALVAAVFLGFSSSYVYWNNMLFSNVPALAFFLGGVYFLVMVVSRPDRLRYYLLAVAFFSMSVWIRYEFVILAALAMLLPLWNIRKLKARYVVYSLSLLAGLAVLVLVLNKYTTGTWFGLPQKAGATASEYVVKYPARFRGLDVLFKNGNMYVYSIAPLLTVVGALGMVWAARNGRRVYAVFMAALGLLVFYYYGNNTQFWGYGRYWFASSYTRYFLPLFVALSFFAALFLVRFFRDLGWKRWTALLLLAFLLGTHVVTSWRILDTQAYGLSYTDTYMGSRKAVDDLAASLPEGAVVVDLSAGWYEKMIVSRTVFVPTRISEESRPDLTREILESLLDSGVPLYVMDNRERNVMTLEDLKGLDQRFALDPVFHAISFPLGGRTPEVYALRWGEI